MLRRLAIAACLVLLGGALVAAGLPGRSLPQEAMPTPHMPPTPSGQGQLVDGEGLYQLYCITCHGDRLLGLTPEWIAQWPATHQNCWVSKCHGPNHPPDGYQLPREVPPLAGPGALARFRSAADLHAFVRARMPYQEPGLLTEDEYWAIEAYLLDFIGVAPLPEVLGPDNAEEIVLNPAAPPTEGSNGATPTPAAAPAIAPDGGTASAAAVAGLALIAAAGSGAVVLYLRRRAGPG